MIKNLTRIHEHVGLIPGLTQWVKDLAGAVAQNSSCRSELNPSLGTSIACRYGPEKKQQTNKQTKNPTAPAPTNSRELKIELPYDPSITLPASVQKKP